MHVIITMNPGYAGRTELPDNLKVMFRPVAMMVPDYALIAEILLFAAGFDEAKDLSRRMVKMYMLSSDQLSQQSESESRSHEVDTEGRTGQPSKLTQSGLPPFFPYTRTGHYDYGLRAVKSVLVMAGAQKRANPEKGEDVVLIKAMCDSNIPKFLEDDLPLFRAIVKDLFPGVKVPASDYGALEQTLRQEIDKAGLQQISRFIEKTIQLYETMNVRFGVAIVGPTGGGKTTMYEVLSSTLTSLREKGDPNEDFQKVRKNVLNPKCITMGELYGEFNAMTQEWTDGLASTLIREAVADTTMDKKWTVFDGPVDALWIENMNTVLDDNMTLCLANGERIKLKSSMKMLFEVKDLEVASPATVSRLGVMYVATNVLGWKPYVSSWIPLAMPKTLSAEVLEHLETMFDLTVPEALKFIRSKCKEPVPTCDFNLVASTCKIFMSIVSKKAGFDFFQKDEDLISIFDKVFAFSFVWSLGGSIRDLDLEGFDDFVRNLFDDKELDAGIPRQGLVYDYFVDMEKGSFVPWAETVEKFVYDPKQPYFQMMVPTESTTKFSYLMKQMLTIQQPVFITGETGTGKSVIVDKLLTSLMPSTDEGGMGVLPVTIGFSAQTKSSVTQQSIISKLEKKRRNLLGAPANKLVVIFVDDINMPEVEEYGAQPPIELLRQYVDFKGFFDREKLFWKDVENAVLFAAAAPPSGGRNPVTSRFKRHFNLFCVPRADHKTMKKMFCAILGGFLEPFNPEV